MTQPLSPASLLAAGARKLLGARPVPRGGLPAFTDVDTGQGTPAGYGETWRDVARARALSVLADPKLHYALYGHPQGRAILTEITAGIDRVVMISPSHLKQCGIGEYGRYLSDELAKQVAEVTVVRTASAAMALGRAALDGALVIVNHGPGLFDGLNPRLSQGESTTRLLQTLEMMRREMGALPLIIHHSLLDTDHDLLFSRQAQILASGIPSLTFISSAGRHFFLPSLELGVSPVPVPEHVYEGNRDERPEVVGFFGFFQYGGKDFDSLFHLVRELRGRLVGSVATSNDDELERFEETLEDLKLPHDFGSGWVEDTELLARLKEADYFYLPQNDYDHWNNSATARFVTNLDRPLFLPPHHPFLDMEDGAIFAAREDLPRIVAHMREAGHYAEAVERVRAFRERARMANTAEAIRTSLVARQTEVGERLMETPAACSAERFLELSERGFEAEQSLFCETLRADREVPESFPALWRAPEPRQYWRKHYELGDLLHGTLLESLHAIYRAITKRPVTFREMLALVSAGQGRGETLRAAILQALEDKGGPFHDPQIVLLHNGRVAEWEDLLDPGRIETFLAEKSARRARIHAQVQARVIREHRPGPQPEITNLAELLLVPARALRHRAAPIDLGALDLETVQAARRPAERLNRLVAAADAAGLRLGDHLVFDHLLPAEVEPRVHSYMLEDFIFFEGDMFLLNAIRRIDKRDPEALEMVVLTAMLAKLGRGAVLEHLLHRAEGRIRILNFDANRDLEAEAAQVQRFMEAARDPLCGLISARNAYEVAKRHNTRWWLRNKSHCDALWTEAKGDLGLLTVLHAHLSETATDREMPEGRRRDPIWRIDREGRFLPDLGTGAEPLPLPAGGALRLGSAAPGAVEAATVGFHPPEALGAWTDGAEGGLLLCPEVPLEAGDRLRVDLAVFGSALEARDLRQVRLSLRPADAPPMPLLDGDGETGFGSGAFDVTDDGVSTVEITVSTRIEGPALLQVMGDGAASPAALGLSDDPRRLGVLVRSLERVAVPQPETAPKSDIAAE